MAIIKIEETVGLSLYMLSYTAVAFQSLADESVFPNSINICIRPWDELMFSS